MIDPALFQTAVVRQAYAYWLAKCRGAEPPSRSDIDPVEIGPLLPYVFLVDVTRAPLTFRFRLVGSKITEWADKEYTGLAVDQRDYGPQWRKVFNLYAEVAASRTPRLDLYSAPWVDREFYQYERIIAPLSSDGTSIDMLFGALHALPEGAT
jgi:hypothetical protein